jgi:predicted Co/Zn/Cd cation transporter (cation efflux family)
MSSQRKLFASAVAALVVSFISGWAVSETHARTASVQLDPFALMTSATQLPTERRRRCAGPSCGSRRA